MYIVVKLIIMKGLLFILLLMPLTVFGQNPEVLENDSKENRFNVGWAYYGRGSGVSLTYDREFSKFFLQGLVLKNTLVKKKLKCLIL